MRLWRGASLEDCSINENERPTKFGRCGQHEQEFTMDRTVSPAILVSETGRGDLDTKFRKQIRLFLHFDRFAAAIAAICKRPHWESDPDALQQLGIVIHCFAPRAQDPCYAYDVARWFYDRAATLTIDSDLRADALASIGFTYLEERRFAAAAHAFTSSLSNNNAQRYALLGQLTIACSHQDVDGIRQGCRVFMSRIPTWHKDRNIVMLLSTSPAYEFLRSSGQLFYECFSGSPADLQALHNMQRIDALKVALVLNTEIFNGR